MVTINTAIDQRERLQSKFSMSAGLISKTPSTNQHETETDGPTKSVEEKQLLQILLKNWLPAMIDRCQTTQSINACFLYGLHSHIGIDCPCWELKVLPLPNVTHTVFIAQWGPMQNNIVAGWWYCRPYGNNLKLPTPQTQFYVSQIIIQ